MKLLSDLRKPYLASFLAGLVLFVSCNPEQQIDVQNNEKLVERLKDSKTLEEVISMTNESLNRIVDIGIIKELSVKDDLSEVEIEKLSIAMGYESIEHYRDFQNDFKSKLNTLKDEYNIGNLTQQEIKKVILNVILEKNLIPSKSNDPCNCYRIARNCIASVTATAVAAHLGCAGLDLTIIAGIICHAAVLVIQGAETDSCVANRDRCLAKCQSL